MSNSRNIQNLHIEGRRWFQKTYGNTYHSVRIFHDGDELAFIPFSYGYGDGYLQSAIDWLFANGHIERVVYGTRFVREELLSTYSVIDVERKKDL